jgi:predicted TIM-barrel fold metal-dependent hydrolase
MDLWPVLAIDHHAHNVLKPEAVARRPFAAAFTEGGDPDIVNHHVRHTLFFRRSVRDLAGLLGCEPGEEAVLAQRCQFSLEALTQRYLEAARLEAILLDDGFLPAEILPLSWHEQFVPVRRVLRVEALAEELLVQTHHFEDFLAQFRARLDPPPGNVVAFKSIASYRTGLCIEEVSQEEARSRFYIIQAKQHDGPGGYGGTPASPSMPVRLENKGLLDFLFTQALEIAGKHDLPMQLHTGFGDPDLDLWWSNPLHLRSILEDPRYRRVPLVLLHASYPYTRESGYLASVYPQVYLDMGLAVPLLSVAGMKEVVRQLLELAPTSKVLYSSDAHLIPDLFYLGARWGREVLAKVLEEAVADGDLSGQEADEATLAILQGNARSLYRLGKTSLRPQGVARPSAPG